MQYYRRIGMFLFSSCEGFFVFVVLTMPHSFKTKITLINMQLFTLCGPNTGLSPVKKTTRDDSSSSSSDRKDFAANRRIGTGPDGLEWIGTDDSSSSSSLGVRIQGC
jgi:hypothetical protein